MNTTQNRRRLATSYRWGHWLPFVLPAVALVALVAVIYASGQRMLNLAEGLARDDAALMNWWHLEQREQLATGAAMVAQRITPESDLAPLAAAAGLAGEAGYMAWIDGEKQVRAELNPEAIVGEPASEKMFAFAPAIGRPTSDFMQADGTIYWLAMAPVSPDKGGGNIVVQRVITEQTMAELAELAGRPVMFYSYTEQTPLLSSDPTLIADPPQLSANWLNQVAAGQLPNAITTKNSQGPLVVGMTAFSDLAAMSYSGYLGLVEPGRQITALIPLRQFWLAGLAALLILLAGAYWLYRTVGVFLNNYNEMTYKQRRAVKSRMVLMALAFFLPVVLATAYILIETSNRSAALDARHAQIAARILTNSADKMTARVNEFATGNTATRLAAQISAETPAETRLALAESLRQAHGLEFAVIEGADGATQAALEALSPDMVAALADVSAGEVDFVQSGKIVMLAAGQATSDGATAVAGVRLNKWFPQITEFAPADLTVFKEQIPWYTTLVEREIESLYFDDVVEAEFQQTGLASYQQKVGWNPGRLTMVGLDIVGSEQWRLVISQASTIWSNAVRGFQAFGLAVLAIALVVSGAVIVTILNLDHPLLLRRMYVGYFFIMPALIWLVWWQLGPALFAGYLSMHKWSVLSDAKPFVGLHNYKQIMQDGVFWNAMKNTFIYVTQIPIGMALALALALALNRQLRGIKALRTIYYMPAVTSIVVVSLMWKLLYNKDLGIFNYLLSFVNLGPYGFLQSTSMALPSIMGMAIWLDLGARMLLFLAGLQSISNDYYEAADVDGASGWRKFWHITLPLLAPTTFFVFITSIIFSFQVFGPVYVLTQGGPVGASDVAVHRIYFEAWQNLRFGYASAETVVLFAFLFIVTAIQFRYFGRNVSYG